MTSNFKGFSVPDFIHYIYFPILTLEKEPVFPFLMFSAKQGNYWYPFFITSLVWRGPWLGIEPKTSRTQSQHSSTRLSRRRCLTIVIGELLFLTSSIRTHHKISSSEQLGGAVGITSDLLSARHEFEPH